MKNAKQRKINLSINQKNSLQIIENFLVDSKPEVSKSMMNFAETCLLLGELIQLSIEEKKDYIDIKELIEMQNAGKNNNG